MRLLKKSQDKNGRDVATNFLDLPDKDEWPEYYQEVKMPLSLNMIEARLEDGEYETMERLESDLKRLVQNAKDFNASNSAIFLDAERIRKALSNFMPKHNPAYLDPNYKAQATPIPRELLDRDVSMHDATPETVSNPTRRIIIKVGENERRKSQAVSTEADVENENDEMRTAQLNILEELSALPESENFEEKPSKKIPGYYAVIKHPTSISDVRRMVEKGKIRDWSSFAAEVRLIWTNCKQFNTEDSEIYGLAVDLEAWFEGKVHPYRMSAASAPQTAKIKLKFGQPQPPGPRVKINMSTDRSTPNPNGGVIDNESLRRQREETGAALIRANRSSSRHGLVNGSVHTPASLKRNGSLAGSSDHPNSVIMTEDTRPTSNHSMQDSIRAVAPVQAQVSKSLPTPALDGLPPAFATHQMNGGPALEVSYTHSSGRNLFTESDNPIDRKYRDPGKGLEDALLESVTYMTHPKLHNDPKWKISRYASMTKTQTTSYIYLPSDHYYLRVIPNLTQEFRSRKRSKVCVTRNWEQVPHSADVAGAFDFRVLPGENIIAVDVIADLAEGNSKPYAPPQLQVDFERITFVIMLRDPTPE